MNNWQTVSSLMMLILSMLIDLVAILTLPGSITLFVLTLAALFGGRSVEGTKATQDEVSTNTDATPQRLAYIIPAHNEETGIAATLESVLGESRSARDIIVIADNCTDRTAEIARTFGVRVIERFDEELRGKGYALRTALQRLEEEPYEVYVIVDADSLLAQGFSQAIQKRISAGALAVQACYLPCNAFASTRARLTRLAQLGFNCVRPRGRSALGLSVGIFGNGFALTRKLLDQQPWNAHSVVEDLEYHLRLVGAGHRVVWAEDALVTGQMPANAQASATQRARWEGGRLGMMRTWTPKLMTQIMHGRLHSLEPLGDLLLLPLSLHVVVLTALTVMGIVLQAGVAIVAGLSGLVIVLLHVLVALGLFGERRDWATLIYVPGWMLWKLMLLPKIISRAGKNAAWERTPRDRKEGPRKI